MQGVTLAIAVVLAVLVLTVRPRHAFVIYIGALLWYPSFLAISIGTIDIMIGRVVVAVLFLRCLCDDRIRSRFKWSRLDKWVTWSIVIYIGITLAVRPTWSIVENRGGFFMDTWLSYMVARFIITDKAKLISIIKCVGIILLPLALLGCIESITGWQPFVPLRRFRPWNPQVGMTTVGSRWGFTRAVGPFSHPILFGGCFAMFLPLLWYLRYQKKDWKNLAYIFAGAAVIGALSSMSAGPWIMTIVIVFSLIMERHKKWVKPAFISFVLLCIVIQLASSTAFYYVFAKYGSRLGGAGMHRAILIDVAIRHFDQWWLVGTKGRDPGWGPYLGMTWTDVTNEYILAGIRYGIAGVIVLCGVLTVAFKQIISSYKKAQKKETRSLYWALGTILFAIAVVWISVSFFGQLISLFYAMLGIISASTLFKADLTISSKKYYKYQLA
ncbi:MAG: hypothetical protein P8016_03160 [Sedimentisphaerales bacterium]